MNSSAYLTRHGWRGEGHSLHPSGRGIKKPLLISKKPNVLGIGTKKNNIHADQWWSRAFDSGLKNLHVTEIGSTVPIVKAESGELSDLQLIRVQHGKWTGLYSDFRKGQGMEGTMASPRSKDTATITDETNRACTPRSKRLESRGETDARFTILGNASESCTRETSNKYARCRRKGFEILVKAKVTLPSELEARLTSDKEVRREEISVGALVRPQQPLGLEPVLNNEMVSSSIKEASGPLDLQALNEPPLSETQSQRRVRKKDRPKPATNKVTSRKERKAWRLVKRPGD